MAPRRRKTFEIHPDPDFYRRRFKWRTLFLAVAIAAGWAGYIMENSEPPMLYFLGVVTGLAGALTLWGQRRLSQSITSLASQVYVAGERSLLCPATSGKRRELPWAQLNSGNFIRRLGGWDLKLSFAEGALTIRALANRDGLYQYLKSLNLTEDMDGPIKDGAQKTQLEMPLSFYFSLAPVGLLLLLELFRPVRAEYLFILIFFNLAVSLLGARKKIISTTGSKKTAAQLWTPLSLSLIFLIVSLIFLYTNSSEAGRWPPFFKH